MRLILDFETRSPVDLLGAGAYSYFEHPSTQVLMACWALNDEDFQLWHVLRDPIPPRLGMAFLNPDCTLVAHNVSFERIACVICGPRQGFLPEPIRQAIKDPMRWSCTAARAAANGLPRALDRVCKALQLPHQKDMDGHRLMLEMCRPRALSLEGKYIWLEDEPRMKRLGEYCIRDGLAERDLDHVLPDLSLFEQRVYAVTERMNDRGVTVDTELLMALISLVRDATNYLNQRIVQLTNGQVPAVTNPGKIVQWLKNYGIDTEDNKIGKWILAGLLEDESLPDIVREVLTIRRDGGKSSTAKFNTLMKRLNKDSRIRGSLLYSGAASTQRWSSVGAQLQNLPRVKTIKKGVNEAIAAILDKDTSIKDIEQKFGPPMVVASELVRPTFIAADGFWLARGDYAQIETRVTAWLAGETRVLEAFRRFDAGTGPDLYTITAADICGVPESEVDEQQRQIGKTTILACSFGGGKNALSKMARLYNIQLSEEAAQEAVSKFREANPQIKSFWYDLDAAAIRCMKDAPSTLHEVRSGIWFKRNDRCLAMRIPSGRYLVYWYPRLEMTDMPWLDADGFPAQKLCVKYAAIDSQKKIWTENNKAWPGIWTENAVQATARDIMAYALVNLEQRKMNPVLTVHDEAVCQLSKETYSDPKAAAEAVRSVMLELPEWAYGLPVSAEASAGPRYVKG